VNLEWKKTFQAVKVVWMHEKTTRRLFLLTVAALLPHSFIVGAKQKPATSFSFDVTDSRAAIYRDVSRDLILRVVKEEKGWRVQVASKPTSNESAWNLLYHSLKWRGPHPSEVYAWHVSERYFSNERTLGVRGYPFEVRIVLMNPAVDGEGARARFKSGKVKISWERKP
jgi:hypothetical protein